jgi:uncharacterized Zn finger protein
MMLKFLVQGSQAEPYTIVFSRAGDTLAATCTCAAGMNNQYCKHRFGLLSGDATDLASENASEINQLPEMLAGSNLEAALRALAEAEAGQQAAAKLVSNCKRAVARAMAG